MEDNKTMICLSEVAAGLKALRNWKLTVQRLLPNEKEKNKSDQPVCNCV